MCSYALFTTFLQVSLFTFLCCTSVVQNFPGRAAPLKETTVFEYILEAAKEGYEMNWKRLCEEMGITQDIYSNIKGAILKVGSRERLKPIKEELPEEVSFTSTLVTYDCFELVNFEDRIYHSVVLIMNIYCYFSLIGLHLH